MSFLIYAYRKLALRRQIGDKEYRQMVVNQQKMTMTDKIALLQQSISSAKSVISNLANSSLFNANQEVMSKYPSPTAEQQTSIYQELAVKQQAIAYKSSVLNSVFEGASQSQMKQLRSQEVQLEQENANIESQLKLMREELTSVEKGETEAAKSEAPKFGLS